MRGAGGARGRWWPRLAVAYAAALGLWLLARLIWHDTFWPLALISSAAVYLFLPLVPLAVWALFVKPKLWGWALLAGPALLFAWLYGPLFLPRLGPAPAGLPLRVLTYNVLWSNADYPAIAATVRASGADLAGFQELTEAHAAALGPLLADYPYQALHLGAADGRVGLVSRYPIESVEALALPPRNLALRALVNVDGVRVWVYVVHLSANNFGLDHAPAEAPGRYAARAAETAQLAADLAALTAPYLLLCECNLTETSTAYGNLRAVLGDSFREAGWGLGHTLTIPGLPLPLQRIDYVWHSAAFYVAAAHVGPRGGSDHYSTWAQLVLIPGP